MPDPRSDIWKIVSQTPTETLIVMRLDFGDGEKYLPMSTGPVFLEGEAYLPLIINSSSK